MTIETAHLTFNELVELERTTRFENKFVDVTFANKDNKPETRTLEMQHTDLMLPHPNYPRRPYVEVWTPVNREDNEVYVLIGRHGKKLHSVKFKMSVDARGRQHFTNYSVLNNNNTRIVSWADRESTDRHLSQHIGEVAQAVRKQNPTSFWSQAQLKAIEILVQNNGTVDTSKVKIDGRALRGLVNWRVVTVDGTIVTANGESAAKIYENNKQFIK